MPLGQPKCSILRHWIKRLKHCCLTIYRLKNYSHWYSLLLNKSWSSVVSTMSKHPSAWSEGLCSFHCALLPLHITSCDVRVWSRNYFWVYFGCRYLQYRKSEFFVVCIVCRCGVAFTVSRLSVSSDNCFVSYGNFSSIAMISDGVLCLLKSMRFKGSVTVTVYFYGLLEGPLSTNSVKFEMAVVKLSWCHDR